MRIPRPSLVSRLAVALVALVAATACNTASPPPPPEAAPRPAVPQQKGGQDLFGTEIFRAGYVTAGKRIGDFDFTLGYGTDRIDGVFGGVRYRPVPDRIEAGTYLLAAAATRGKLTLTDVEPKHLTAVLDVLARTGVAISVGPDSVSIDAGFELSATDVEAQEYPGVPTDLQAPISAFLATIDGISHLSDTIYPDRFTHVEELARTGVGLSLNDRTLEVRGGRLKGAAMHSADIRAGGALVIAALAANGSSEIGGLRFIDRGYERLAERLSSLGADVHRQATPPAIKLTSTGTFGD